MNEATFWSSRIAKVLHVPVAGRVAWKVPAELRKGIPDVWFANYSRHGWLELKYIPAWPKRASTDILVAVSPEQHAHLREAAQAPGVYCGVLLGIAQDIFLFDWHKIFPMARVSREWLVESAAVSGDWATVGCSGLAGYLVHANGTQMRV